MSGLPRVSFVIAAYNSADTVAATVESCLAQSHPDVEVVVVDDGSRDATRSVLEGFGERIRLLSRKNTGLATARSDGMRMATGEFIAWMDDDDLAHPDRARLGAAVLAAHPEVTLVSSDFSAFNDVDGEIEASHIRTYYGAVRRLGGMEGIYPQRLEDQGGVSVRCGPAYEKLLVGNFVHPPTLMMRRADFDRVGWFDPVFTHTSDYDMIVRLSRLGPFAFLEAPLLRYRKSASQLSHAGGGGRVPLDTVRVLEKIRREDPAVCAKLEDALRDRYARSYLEAAEYLDRSRKLDALGFLARSFRYRAMPRAAARVLLKILVPRAVVRAVKGALGRAPANR